MTTSNGWEVKKTTYGVSVTKDDNLYLLVNPIIWDSQEWKEKEVDKYIRHNMRPIQEDERPEIVAEILKLAA